MTCELAHIQARNPDLALILGNWALRTLPQRSARLMRPCTSQIAILPYIAV